MKRAYNILIKNNRVQKGPVVVETDPQGKVLGWHPLMEEEPFVEWVGGQVTIDSFHVK